MVGLLGSHLKAGTTWASLVGAWNARVNPDTAVSLPTRMVAWAN
jgi:hypothetical protein